MPKAIITMPCVAGVSEEIRRMCRRHDMKVVFRASRTLHSLLTRVKDPLPTTKHFIVVYQILCSCGQVYTGQTT